MDTIQQALTEGRTTLSEHEAKQLLATYGIPVAREILVRTIDELSAAISEIGFPLVLKGCAPDLSHKTELGVVRVDIRSEQEAVSAFKDIMGKLDGSAASVLVQEMIGGRRELMVGLTRDPQFGPCVLFGLGGIFTEILKDVTFRLAPLEPKDAESMMGEIRGHRILDAVRGMEAVDRDVMAGILMNVGKIGLEQERVKEIDINPLIIRNGIPVAVDALVVLG